MIVGQVRNIFVAAAALALSTVSTAHAAGDAALRGVLAGVPSPFIVNGVEAPEFKYTKWMVGLLEESYNRPFCGGSYIGKNWVVTAAHCVDDLPQHPRDHYAEANRHDWRNTFENGRKLPITAVYVHPDYNKDPANSNDIALLKVKGGPVLDAYPELDDGSASSEDSDRSFKIIGWGSTKSGGNQSPFLLEALVNLVPTERCQKLYKKPSLISPTMICASAPGTDTCQGDSGGPMFVEKDDASPVTIVGLTSWGYGCAGPAPGVYSRVSSLRSFIDKIVGCRRGTTFTGGKCQKV